MAYIPTIHTFEDDINENILPEEDVSIETEIKKLDLQKKINEKEIEVNTVTEKIETEEEKEIRLAKQKEIENLKRELENTVKSTSINNSLNTISKRDEASILVDSPIKVNKDFIIDEENKKSGGSRVLTVVAIFFILATIALAGYYFYDKNEKAKQIAAANQLSEQAALEKEEESLQNKVELESLFGDLAVQMATYLDLNEIIKNGNIIYLKIKADFGDEDNFAALFALISGNQKSIAESLIKAFKLNELENQITEDQTNNEENNNVADNATNSEDILDVLENDFTQLSTPKLITADSIVWEKKTLDNQDFWIANVGITTLIYGFVDEKYVIFTTSLKDFFDIVDLLKE